ncbi:MAG: bifunctional glycosyltransferase family 2/GtrA family protein [Actinobacteria bacterium]|nr:bifunctional glycosyltransferase family 2/GtrA family protein [Actinomycetota bacterium]
MIVLIPSYEPDDRLPALVADLTGFAGVRVVVVDDGSGPDYAPVFARTASAGARVLTGEVNRGKGAALRVGFAHIRAEHPGEPVVCADSDGQHTVLDILRVAAAIADGDRVQPDMVLGVRRFTGRVPLRSRVGNVFTAGLFALVTGCRITDTQTGLRGYPHRTLAWLEEVPGDRFEYELNLLLRAARERLRIEQVEIATVYLADNASSHFRPVLDSLRVLRPLAGYAASSLAGFGVDAAALFVLYAVSGNLALSVVAARLLSATVNFLLNRHVVFGAARAPLWPAVRRYALLAAGILAANLALMELLTPALGVVVAKVLTEVGLFAVGYAVQSRLVFAAPARPAVREGGTTVHPEGRVRSRARGTTTPAVRRLR